MDLSLNDNILQNQSDESENTQVSRCAFEAVVYIIYYYSDDEAKSHISYKNYRLWIIENFKMPAWIVANKIVKKYVYTFIKQLNRFINLQEIIYIISSKERLNIIVIDIIKFFLNDKYNNSPLNVLISELIKIEKFHLHDEQLLFHNEKENNTQNTKYQNTNYQPKKY